MAEKSIKNFCNRCQYETNHTVLHESQERSDHDDYHYGIDYMIVKCAGCEVISFREDFHDYEATYPDEYDNWHHDTKTTLYPSPLKNHRSLSRIYNLPDQIRIVYEEAVNAFKANCYLLTGVAFRAVIEALCIDKSIKGRNLEVKINNLVKDRLITEKEGARLHSIRFIGNDSVHEMSIPKTEALYIVLDIVEHLLKNLYLIDEEAKRSLETIVDNYDDFVPILNRCLKKFILGDEYPLAKFLSKDVRRLNGKIQEFESELLVKINDGSCKNLSIGKNAKFGNSKGNIQHYKLI
jgi:hypothetical protein